MNNKNSKDAYYYPKQFRSKANMRDEQKSSWKTVFMIAVMLGFGGIVYFAANPYPQMALPHNGAIIRYEKMRDDVYADFIVESDKSDVNVNSDVKISRWDSGEPVADMFVLGGHDASIKLPLGKYRIKISQGQKWYGVEHLFGVFTTTDEFTKPIVIYQNDSGEFIGVALDMRKRVLGNFPSRRVIN